MSALPRFACLAFVALVLPMCAIADALAADDFFAGKTITILIGFGAGGEDDLWARTIARHLGNHIPGNPAVVPENVPGAGGLLVANRLYNTMPKDGTVIGLMNRGIPFEPLLGGQGDQFDALKFNYIGSPGRDTTVCAARKDAAVKTMQDLYSEVLTVGGTGSGADTAIYPRFLSALLGMRFKIVLGYKGSHDIQLAMERNEVQGICLAYDSLERGTLAQEHQINVLLQASYAQLLPGSRDQRADWRQRAAWRVRVDLRVVDAEHATVGKDRHDELQQPAAHVSPFWHNVNLDCSKRARRQNAGENFLRTICDPIDYSVHPCEVISVIAQRNPPDGARCGRRLLPRINYVKCLFSHNR